MQVAGRTERDVDHAPAGLGAERQSVAVPDLDSLEDNVAGGDANLAAQEIRPALAAQRVIADVENGVVDVDVPAGMDVNAVAVGCLDGPVVGIEDVGVADDNSVAVLKVQRPHG